MGNAVQIVLSHKFRGTETLLIISMLLCIFCNFRHCFHSFNRVFTSGGFSGKHDAGGSVVHSISNVRNLRSGGTGILNHGFQHFRSSDNTLPQKTALTCQLLLYRRDFHIGNLHTQVATGDHNAAAGGADVLHIVHAGLVLDLRHNLDIAAAIFIQKLLDIQNILLG